MRRGGDLHTARAVAACFAWVEEDAWGEKKCRGRRRKGSGMAEDDGLFVRCCGCYFGLVAVLERGESAAGKRMEEK